MKSCKARIVIRLPTPRHAKVVYSALEPEARLLDSESSPAIAIRSNAVIFEIESADLSAFRASLNSFIRLADSAYRCLRASEETEVT